MGLKNILFAALASVLLQKTSFTSIKGVSALHQSETVDDPNIYYTTIELACSEGYSVQEHLIITKDGYLLTLYRIPNGRNRPKVLHNKHQYHKIHLNYHPDFEDCVRESLNQTSTGFPVLFVHGILQDSDSWLLQGPDYDLAYLLADNGYDVWFVNIRGNFYSRKHISLSPSDPNFWDFSFHENAVYDIPATIDYILKVTKRDKLGYVGFSMGTTIFFAMNSMRPEYNQKILGFVALAPVVYIKKEYMSPRRRKLFEFLDKIANDISIGLHTNELLPRNSAQVNIAKKYCSEESYLQDTCYDVVSTFVGYPSRLYAKDKLQLYLSHLPSGTTIKNIKHYMQNLHQNSFKLYDYGSTINKELYGSIIPPDYPLWNITTPVGLYYSDNDLYYDVKDIQDLRRILPNVVDVAKMNKFNHLDFLWSFTAKDTLYSRVAFFFKELTNSYNFQIK